MASKVILGALFTTEDIEFDPTPWNDPGGNGVYGLVKETRRWNIYRDGELIATKREVKPCDQTGRLIGGWSFTGAIPLPDDAR